MYSSQKPRLIVIVGPTGVGKTEMAVELARERNGEIISADSMQVYKFMDIGTAKPTASQRQQVRHHLIDVVNPDEYFNAAMFREMAAGVISTLVNHQKTVFVVGGTGLYIKALLGGLFAGPGGNESVRAFYRLELKRFGKAYLYEKLREKDEQAAARIDRNDAVRIIRALEVLELSGESIVEKQKAHGFSDRLYDCIKIGLTMERPLLYKKIEERSGKMVRDGLVDEVRRLLDMGYHENLKPMRSLGYKHMSSYVKGVRSLEDALKMMQRDTKRYAKRQVTWFGADREIVWFSPQGMEEVRKYIDRFLGCEKYRNIKVLPGALGTKL